MVLAQLSKFLPSSPDGIFHNMPQVHNWVQSLGKMELAKFIQGVFAYLEIVHILGLFMLAGAVILTCLRLMGVLLTSEPVSVVEKNTRPFLHIGVILAIGSGLLIGMSNADKLYNSEVFTVKMIAMVAGIIFSYFVMIPVAKAEGQANGTARIGMVVAMVLWLLSLVTFSVRLGSNPGMFHVLWGGALVLVAALQGKLRWVYLIGLAILIVVWNVVTHVFILEATGDAYSNANKLFMYLTGLWIFGLALLNVFGKAAVSSSNAFARMTAFATILVWVTVGAGGRWIGLS